jgi:PKD repeat protein
MVWRELNKKIVAFGITVSLLVLIFLVLTPSPSTAVYLNPGKPSSTSVYTDATITFSNVNLTIRGPEAIPVNYLNFSIRQSSNNQEIAYVKFSFKGTKISDSPVGKFTVTPITNTSNLPYQSSGNYYGYDERTGANYSFGYGYGYGTGQTSLTILYTITYTTHTAGTFYAKLYVNSTINATIRNYISGSSTAFTVSSQSSPPGGGGSSGGGTPTANAGGPYTGVVGTPVQFDGSKSTAISGTTISSYRWSFGDGSTSVGMVSTHTYTTAGNYTVNLTVTNSTGTADTDSTTATISPIPPSSSSELVSNQTMQAIENATGVTLAQRFYANDSNGDGIVDVFTDPNHVLIAVSNVTINGHPSFLISTHNDNIPEFFWDTATNTITPVTHTPAPLTTPFIDTAKKTVTIEITVNKTGWIYLDITDQYPLDEYPHYTFTVKTANRTISSDRIWRKNGRIYILDDPAILYDLIYEYTILPPTFNPRSGTTLTISKPTITITYPQQVSITTAFLDTKNIMYQITSTDQKTFLFTPTTDLTDGTHTLSLTVQDGQNTLTSTATYTMNLANKPPEIPWITITIIAVILVTVVLLVVLRLQLYI